MDEKRNYDPNAGDSVDLVTYLGILKKQNLAKEAEAIKSKDDAEINRALKAYSKMPRKHRINYQKAICGTPKPSAVQIKDNEGRIYWSEGYGESCHPETYKMSKSAFAEFKKKVFAYESFYEKHDRNILLKLAAFIKWLILNIAIPATVFLTMLIMLWKVIF